MFDIGPGIEQSVDQMQIVVAGCPMEWSFKVLHSNCWRIEIGARGSEQPYNRRCVRMMPGPVGEQMQQRSSAAVGIQNDTTREAWIGREQASQVFDFAALERRRKFDGKRIVAIQCTWLH
ncbi:MAG TPA: hypothetical protein VHY35_16865 [Stellaceae bacterium]|nr:hypothetical protein [Stellaceae bacterium]